MTTSPASLRIPKTGEKFRQVSIRKGELELGRLCTVADRDRYSLSAFEFTDGGNRYSAAHLYPCPVGSGPAFAPLQMAENARAFLYCFEEDTNVAARYLRREYRKQCKAVAKESETLAANLRRFTSANRNT